jgi:hypothetical protein
MSHDINDLTSEASSPFKWQQHYDPGSGFYYFRNTEDGETSLEPQLYEEFLPCITKEDNRESK